ncbi:MAG: glycoside hydrolase family 9 protein [Fibrobacter sp.]|nr:glycoside hydrolase family 9 protein [Fibrobacter sp.]
MPYDLIRPVYPLTWDTTVFDRYDTTVTKKHNVVPKKRIPSTYIPNTFVPDTLDQAYLDAMNSHISPIRVNQAGYLESDPEKEFYYVGTATTFEVVDADGKSLSPKVTGTLTSTGQDVSTTWNVTAGTNAATNDQKRYSVKFIGPTGGLMMGNIPQGLPTDTRLRIKVGNEISSTFIVSERVYSMVRSAALKFYGINRSGNSESWFHPASHTKDGGGPVVQGPVDERGPYNAALAGTLEGGWYDCGDHLKEAATQMYAFMVAALMAAANPETDEDNYAFNQSETVNTDGMPDMLREAKHGADFVLRSYVRAKGVVDDMALSVGNFGSDHGWWGRPENSDNMPVDNSNAALDRGGPASRTVRQGEVGANYGGEAAAGLAIVGKMYSEYPEYKDFADSCIMVAEKMYEFAKALAQGKSFTHNKALAIQSPAYQGNNEYVDDMALASVALLYATGKKEYADDMMRTKNLYPEQKVSENGGAAFFEGGWFVTENQAFLKNTKNTSWANSYTYALYALYKLILKDKTKAINEYGLTETEWLNAIEDCIANMIVNIGDMGAYDGVPATFDFPQVPNIWKQSSVTYDKIWNTMHVDQNWIYNRYRAGDIFDILAYAEVAADIEKQGIVLPAMGTPNWKADEAKQFAIRQLNYLLGVNPWDVSFIMGVGDKNDAHPHHRAANPEGKNQPGAAYKYKVPVGGFYGAVPPALAASMGTPGKLAWEDYEMSELCIDAAAVFVGTVTLASQKIDRTVAPDVSVQIRHVSKDSAIVTVKLSKRGTTTLYYGTSETAMTEIAVPDNDAAGVQHEIILRELQNGTTYYFYAVGKNAYNPENQTTKYMVDSTKTPFSFTTLNTVESAEIVNVTVCNLLGDSAEIMWYTPNGEYESKIYWDTIPHATAAEYAFNSGAGNADVSGIPTKFHYVKIGGLKEQTTYYYMVESNGQFTNTDEKTGEMLRFTTPVMWYDFSVRAYQYIFDGLDFLNLNIYNNESRPFDDLTLRLYFTAKPEQVDKCATLIDSDICFAYDEAGFSVACENDREIRDSLRHALPIRLDDTYNPEDGTYSYYFPARLGSTLIKSQSRLRIDFGFSSGISNDGFVTCETLRQPGKKRFTKNSGDWTWRPHTFLEDGADYDGMPIEDKDYGDVDAEVPIDPYIAVYRRDEFIWGISPSRQEMSTKRAHYKMDVTFDAPFNVSNNSYVQIDQTSSTVYVKGYAKISEQGYITRIWANGTEIKAHVDRLGNEIFLISDNSEVIAHYNVTDGGGEIDSTGLWSLNIPVKMKIGSNKIDLTIFAGADPECEECSENGGCAFINRTYYVQFTRGNLTASSLTIKDEKGNPVSSPADPSNTRFYIYLNDKDKAGTSAPIEVLVINNRKNDTLKVKMVEDASNPGSFKSSAAITALSVAPEARNGTQISFFAGDTIQVVYIDPDDEEDVSKQSFFAESKYPEPTKVLAKDSDCDNVADKLVVSFSNTLIDDYSFDSIRVYLPGMADTVTLKVDAAKAKDQSDVVIDLPASLGIEATAAPSGMSTVYMKAEGATNASRMAITDGILPQLLSVTILENPDHQYEQDTLMIAFTEPVMLNSASAWPLEIMGATGAAISVVGKATTSNDGKSWLYAITGNTDGNIVKEGVTVTVKSNMVADKALNLLDPTQACTQIKVVETPRPVPVTLAEMRDLEGDGYVNELYLRFEKKLRPKDMLDSFVVEWGLNGEVRNLLPEWEHTYEYGEHTENVLGPDSSIVEVTVKDTVSVILIKFTSENSFAYGSTTGPYDTYGRVTPRLGPEGGFFDKFYPVVDKCPPVILTAVWQDVDAKDDTYGSLDILTLTLSEPMNTVAEHPYVVERNRDGKAGVFFSPKQNPDVTVSYIDNTTSAKLNYRHKYDEAIWIGDSVRLISDSETSYFVDKAGQYAGYATPWVPVTGSVSNIRFTITAVDGVTKSRNPDSTYYGGIPLDENVNFRLTTLDKLGETVVLAEGESELHDVFGAPIRNYHHAGPVFMIEIALPEVLDKTTLGESKRDYKIKLEMDAFSNMGAYVNKATYSFMSSQMQDYISAGSVLTLYLEWCAPVDYPVSSKGKKIGTGPYIAKFLTDAKSEYLPQKPDEGDRVETIKDSDTFTKTFGFRRARK